MITDYFFDERLRVKYGKIAEEKFGRNFIFTLTIKKNSRNMTKI